jgi:hypothetical protein
VRSKAPPKSGARPSAPQTGVLLLATAAIDSPGEPRRTPAGTRNASAAAVRERPQSLLEFRLLPGERGEVGGEPSRAPLTLSSERFSRSGRRTALEMGMRCRSWSVAGCVQLFLTMCRWSWGIPGEVRRWATKPQATTLCAEDCNPSADAYAGSNPAPATSLKSALTWGFLHEGRPLVMSLTTIGSDPPRPALRGCGLP